MTRYTLYVPVEAYVPAAKEIISEMTRVFGGCTMTQGTGSWIREDGIEISERVYIFTYLSIRPWHDVQYEVRTIERRITDMTGEDCILSTNEQTNMSYTLKLPK